VPHLKNLPFFRRWSLKTRVTLFTLIIFVSGIWALAFYASRALHADIGRLLGDQQFSTVSFMAAEVDEAVDDRLKALELVASRLTPTVMNDAEALDAFLKARPAAQAMFNAGILALDLEGKAIGDSAIPTDRLGVNYGDRDYVAGALRTGKPTVGRPVLSKILRSPSISMAVPIRDAQGKVIGALAGLINLAKPSFLSKITDNTYGRTGGYLLIARPQRQIITATDKSRIMEILPAPGINPLIDRFVQGYEGSAILFNPRGQEVLASAKTIPAADWYVVATLPTQEAFAPLNDLLRRLLLTTALLTLVAGGLTWWMMLHQLNPMFSAVTALTSVAQTNQPLQPLPVTSRDEIGELIGGFNRLLGTIGQRETMLARTERIAHLGSWTWDAATDTVQWSDELFRIFQLNPGKGAPSFAEHQTLYFPEDFQRLKVAVGVTIKEGIPYELELRAIRKDGEARICLARGYSETGPGKPATRLFGSLQDITELKQAEEKLRLKIVELQRWHDVTLDREERVQELKREVNDLLIRQGKPNRYASQEGKPPPDKNRTR